MIVEVKVPEVGESITEGVLVEWLKADGELVQTGEELFELETDKVTMAVPADVAGRLSTQADAGEVVKVGQVVAQVDTAASAPAEVPLPEAAEPPAPAAQKASAPAADDNSPAIAPKSGMDQARQKASASDSLPLSPAVRRLVEEHGLDPSNLSGTGKGGRLTKGDVLTALEEKSQGAPAAAPPVSQLQPVPAPQPLDQSTRETRTKMSRLRQRITERLVQVQQTAAILTTFNEVDMSSVMGVRKRYRDLFEKRFDVRLGFMSFFVRAVADALRTVPRLNVRLDGDEIVQQHYYDIGVAVGTDQGLVVPVVRDADKLSFATIEETISSLAKKARERKLTLPDLSGGCFTISNGGVYGSLLSTPILNPPQSGILGLHRIQKRPVVVDDEIVIRPMMFLALSYDHRVVDGAEAVTFLKRIVECIEDPERMLLEV